MTVDTLRSDAPIEPDATTTQCPDPICSHLDGRPTNAIRRHTAPRDTKMTRISGLAPSSALDFVDGGSATLILKRRPILSRDIQVTSAFLFSALERVAANDLDLVRAVKRPILGEQVVKPHLWLRCHWQAGRCMLPRLPVCNVGTITVWPKLPPDPRLSRSSTGDDPLCCFES